MSSPRFSIASRKGVRPCLQGTLFCLLLLTATAFTTTGWSQTRKKVGDAKEKEPPRFVLLASILGDVEVPPLFYLEKNLNEAGEVTENYHELPVEQGTLRGRQSLQLHRPTSLYIQKPGTETKSTAFEPYLEIPAKSASDQLLLLFYQDEAGRPLRKIIDASPTAHPAGTVRMINLTRTRAALTAGGNPLLVAPGMEARTSPVPQEDGRFPLVVSQETAGGGVYRSPLRLLQFRRPGHRLLVVFSSMPVLEDTGEFAKDGSALRRRVFRPDAFLMPDTVPDAKGTNPVASATPVVPIPEATSTITSPAPRENQIGVLALGAKWQGGELEMKLPEASGVLRVKLEPEAVVPVKVPASGETRIALSHAGLPLGEVTLGQSATSGLLALAPPAHIEDPAVSRMFETSEQSHPRGTTRIFNLTPYQMAFTSGGKPVYVNPQSSALIEDVKPGSEIPLKLALEVDGGWKLIDQTPKKSPASDKRTGLFVYPGPPDSGSFTVLEKTL